MRTASPGGGAALENGLATDPFPLHTVRARGEPQRVHTLLVNAFVNHVVHPGRLQIAARELRAQVSGMSDERRRATTGLPGHAPRDTFGGKPPPPLPPTNATTKTMYRYATIPGKEKRRSPHQDPP